MSISNLDSENHLNDENRAVTNSPSTSPTKRTNSQSLSMHDGIAVWCDCCSCEAEPYWADLAEDFGMDLSDYEETKSPSHKQIE